MDLRHQTDLRDLRDQIHYSLLKDLRHLTDQMRQKDLMDLRDQIHY
jgi:hypothetical protein